MFASKRLGKVCFSYVAFHVLEQERTIESEKTFEADHTNRNFKRYIAFATTAFMRLLMKCRHAIFQ